MQPAGLPRVKRTHRHEKTKNPPLPEGLKRGELTRSIAGSAYFFAAPRLNFVVNFSTRPAVSTRRFSPV